LIAAHPKIEMLYEANWLWMDHFRSQRDFSKGDQLFVEDVTPKIKNEINEVFTQILASNDQASILLEKDPRHSLRIPFINVVFPRCKFIHIVRDGRNVACSLMRRHKEMRTGHMRKKKDHQWWRSGDGWAEQRIQDWQRYRELPLIDACAWQWRLTLEKTKSDLSQIEPERTLSVRYEDLVVDPLKQAETILSFIGVSVSREVACEAAKVHDRASKWQEILSRDQQRVFREIAGTTLIDCGYEISDDWVFERGNVRDKETSLFKMLDNYWSNQPNQRWSRGRKKAYTDQCVELAREYYRNNEMHNYRRCVVRALHYSFPRVSLRFVSLLLKALLGKGISDRIHVARKSIRDSITKSSHVRRDSAKNVK
jgi:hypothetical protein